MINLNDAGPQPTETELLAYEWLLQEAEKSLEEVKFELECATIH